MTAIPSSAALQGLPGSHVLSELKRLEVSIAKLRESNELLEEFLKGNEVESSTEGAGDSTMAGDEGKESSDDAMELQQATTENEGVM